jgi:uroporphyrinogen-III decarboxylase
MGDGIMPESSLTDKQRIYDVLEGRPVDRMPVTSLHSPLYTLDHFGELTGREDWRMYEWTVAPPREHLATYRAIAERAPFDILQPQLAPPRRERERVRVVTKDGQVFLEDKHTGEVKPPQTVYGHATDYNVNQTRYVHNKHDLNERIKLRTAERQIADGVYEYAQEVVSAFGNDHFILTGGVVSTLFLCHDLVGMTNLLQMLAGEPDLVDDMSKRILEQNIEDIRATASAGGDAIYIDDATAMSDTISVQQYERFCQPYIKQMVDEIRSLGQKAILMCSGDISNRIEQIISIGADGLSIEAGAKAGAAGTNGSANDIVDIAQKTGRRVALFGNIDPVGVLQGGSDALLEAEVCRQAKAKGYARGFITCTGGPITPFTSLERVQRFIDLAKTV